MPNENDSNQNVFQKLFDQAIDYWFNGLDIFWTSFKDRIVNELTVEAFLERLATTGPLATLGFYGYLPFTSFVFAVEDFRSHFTESVILAIAETAVALVPIDKKLRQQVMTLDDVVRLMLRSMINALQTIQNPPSEFSVLQKIYLRRKWWTELSKILALDVEGLLLGKVQKVIITLILTTIAISSVIFIIVWAWTLNQKLKSPDQLFDDALQQNNPIVPDQQLGLKRERKVNANDTRRNP